MNKITGLAIPYFYIDSYNSSQPAIVLNEDTSKHIVQVLRMKKGEKLNLTDGKGNLLIVEIEDDHKKHCLVKVIDTRFVPGDSRKISIGISLIKNTSRFEWFLEKAAEIGIHEIIPLVCERTEKQKFRADRMKSILVSAMLQSQQSRLPVLREPVSIKKVIEESGHHQKFIAHCMEEKKADLSDLVNDSLHSQIILVGPEGDFTKDEIDTAVQHHFIAVTLGETRLRTETAGIVAATILKLS
ncbi:MAG: RsmE family RNA methyltransferase [Bacteroidota bacterium]